jgi:hypothetical protein
MIDFTAFTERAKSWLKTHIVGHLPLQRHFSEMSPETPLIGLFFTSDGGSNKRDKVAFR